MKEKFSLFGSDERIIEFKTPLEMEVEQQHLQKDIDWTMDNEEFNIHIYGKTYIDAIEMLIDEVIFLVDEYVCAPDSKLAPDAQELKRKLKKMIKSDKGRKK